MSQNDILRIMKIKPGHIFTIDYFHRQLKITKPALNRNLNKLSKFGLISIKKERPTSKARYFLK